MLIKTKLSEKPARRTREKRNPHLHALFGSDIPLVTRIRAEWKSFKKYMRAPTKDEIVALKRRVDDLEKRLSR